MLTLLFNQPSGSPVPDNQGYRDADIYDDIIARLEATRVFTYVSSFETVGPDVTADNTYLVKVIPGEGEDIDICDPIVIERKVTFKLIIDVQEIDPRTRWRIMDQISNVARNALNGQSLANMTFPDLTIIRRYQSGKATNPTQAFVLSGECIYQVQGFDGFNTDG